MTRIFGFLIAFLLILYGLWPYYGIYRLDQALSRPDAEAIAPFVDLQAIQSHYKSRLNAGVEQVIPDTEGGTASFADRLSQGIRELGGKALDQLISVDLVRGILRNAVLQATDERPAYLIAAIDAAFFNSWNGFAIRLGSGDRATHIEMRLEGVQWRITDIKP